MPANEVTVRGAAQGRWATNAYLVGDRGSGAALVVDPGEGAEASVPALLDGLGLACAGIVLTHGHLDHLWAAPALAERYDVGVHLHPEDRWLWDDPAAAFGVPGDVLAEQLGMSAWSADPSRLVPLADGGQVRLAGVALDVRHNPGHTPGHCTFLLPAGRAVDATLEGRSVDVPAAVLFSGDLVFAGSIGRSDLARGSHPDLLASLAATLDVLDGDTVVLSGHGPATTLERERRTNPFLRDLAGRG